MCAWPLNVNGISVQTNTESSVLSVCVLLRLQGVPGPPGRPGRAGEDGRKVKLESVLFL